jgi:hypothetical protein
MKVTGTENNLRHAEPSRGGGAEELHLCGIESFWQRVET